MKNVSYIRPIYVRDSGVSLNTIRKLISLTGFELEIKKMKILREGQIQSYNRFNDMNLNTLSQIRPKE